MKISIHILILLLVACNGATKEESIHGKIGTYNELKKELKSQPNPYSKPSANISELESEINNGGLNQYFFNSSGQNCFATLRLLEREKKTNTATILRAAIDLINPENLSEEELVKKIRNREVDILDDDEIRQKLDSLDQLYYQLDAE